MGRWGRSPRCSQALIVNFGLFLAAFRFLTSATIATRCLWIGVAFAAVFWEVLQFFGGLYINHVFRHASATYSQFALVIALLVLLHLGAQVTLYAAEINVVLARGLYPRSLLGPPDSPADKETLTALAKVEERHDEEQVEVAFAGRAGRREGSEQLIGRRPLRHLQRPRAERRGAGHRAHTCRCGTSVTR